MPISKKSSKYLSVIQNRIHYANVRRNYAMSQHKASDDPIILAVSRGLRRDQENERLASFSKSQKKEIETILECPLRDFPESQSIDDYITLQRVKRHFDSIVRSKPNFISRKPTDSSKIAWGTAESDSFDSFILPVPESDEYLIIINRNMIEPLEAISRIIAKSLDYSAPIVTYNSDKAARYRDLFLAIASEILSGKELWLSHIPQYSERDQNPYETQFSDFLYDGMLSFVFGHEYAHHLFDHISQAQRLENLFIGEEKLNAVYLRWVHEFEADICARNLCIFRLEELSMNKSLSVGHSGILTDFASTGGRIAGVMSSLAFLTLRCVLERIKGIVYNEFSHHPPTMLRLASIWRHTETELGTNSAMWLLENRFKSVLRCGEHFLDYFDATTRQYTQIDQDYANYAILSPGTPRIQVDLHSDIAIEKQFQDSVFILLFENSAHKIINDLNSMLSHLKLRNKLSNIHQRPMFFSSWWESPSEILSNAISSNAIAIHKAEEMISVCIRILENLIRGI